jgi:hypothetical protein
MFALQITTAASRIARKTTGVAAIAAVAAAFLTAGPAHADFKNPPPGKGCPVENSDGTTSTVEVGTKIGLFVCGADGEWHFGWVVTGVSSGKTVKPVNPIRTGTIQHRVRISARAPR